MTPTDHTRPADGPGPDSGHTETHDAGEGLRGRIAPETIAELRGLLSPLTTPRPWHVWDRGIGWEIHEGADAECLSEYGCNAEGCEPINNGQRDTFSFPDAELIAAAVNALPALLDAAERLAEVAAERDAVGGIVTQLAAAVASAAAERDALIERGWADEKVIVDLRADLDKASGRQSLARVVLELDTMRDLRDRWEERASNAESERDALAASVARVRAALDSHPDPTCDEYASKGPISCGWKSALIDVRWALADGSES